MCTVHGCSNKTFPDCYGGLCLHHHDIFTKCYWHEEVLMSRVLKGEIEAPGLGWGSAWDAFREDFNE